MLTKFIWIYTHFTTTFTSCIFFITSRFSNHDVRSEAVISDNGLHGFFRLRCSRSLFGFTHTLPQRLQVVSFLSLLDFLTMMSDLKQLSLITVCMDFFV